MRLLDRLEPTLGSEEEGYRLHFLSVDRAQAAGSVLIALALVLGVFVLELNYFDRRQLVPIAIVLMVLGFYALSPTPLLKRAMPAIGLTTGFVLVLWLVRGDISEEEPRLMGKTQPLALPGLRFRFWF